MPFIRTPDEFSAAVVLEQTTETKQLDFKQDLHQWAAPSAFRRDGQKEFCRDVSQFANTTGGCILIGITEQRVNDARVAAGIVGVDDFDRRRAWMEQAIQNFLIPSAFGVMIDRIVVQGSTVIAVNIPPSEHLVIVWDGQQSTIECFRRTNHGKQAMHANEMGDHAMNSRRAAKLAFDRVRGELPDILDVDLVSGVWTRVKRLHTDPSSIERIPEPEVSLITAGEHELELRIRTHLTPEKMLPAPTIRIPYGLLRESWATSHRRIGIFLHVRVVQRAGLLALEPF